MTIFEKRRDFEMKKTIYQKELQKGKIPFIDV